MNTSRSGTFAAIGGGTVKKILVVDDSETIRQHVADALTRVGFQVIEASDGAAGLQRTEQHDCSMIDHARQNGAKAWLIKPIKVESLVSTVNKVLQQQGAS